MAFAFWFGEFPRPDRIHWRVRPADTCANGKEGCQNNKGLIGGRNEASSPYFHRRLASLTLAPSPSSPSLSRQKNTNEVSPPSNPFPPSSSWKIPLPRKRESRDDDDGRSGTIKLLGLGLSPFGWLVWVGREDRLRQRRKSCCSMLEWSGGRRGSIMLGGGRSPSPCTSF